MSPNARKITKTVLPLLVSAALLLWLALHIDFSASLALFRQLPLSLTAIALACTFLSCIFSSLRFWLLARAYVKLDWVESAGLNLLTVLSAHGLGLLSDGLRVHYLMRLGSTLRHSIDITLADRLLSLWLLLVCAALLLPCALMLSPLHSWAYAASAIILLALLAGAWLCSKPFFPGWLQPCLNVFSASIANKGKLISQLFFALLCCIAIAGTLMALAMALGINLPLHVALAFAPLSVLAASIPFTFAGLGTRETAFAFGLPLLAPAVSQEQAMALALGFGALMLLASTPGLLFLPRIARK